MATYLGPDGFETGSSFPTGIWTVYGGSPTIDTTTKHLGSNALKLTGTGTQGVTTTDNLNKSISYLRVYFRVHVTSNPTGAQYFNLVINRTQTGVNLGSIRLSVTTGGVCSLQLYNETTESAIGSDYAISTDTWYRLEMKQVISATVGELEMKVDGTSRASGTGLNTGSTNLGYCRLQTTYTNGTMEFYFDDFVANDSGYPGPAPSGAWPVIGRRRMTV